MRAGRIWLLALAVTAALPAAAHAAPTSVTVLRGELDTGPTRVLVANEQVGNATFEFLVLRVDDVADDESYPLRLVRGGCKTAAQRRPLASVRVSNGRVVSKRARIPRRAIRGPLSWVVPEVDDEVLFCSRMSRPAPGSIVSPRDSASGQATGVVALQRRAQRMRVTAMFNPKELGVDKLLGASPEPCGLTSNLDLWQWRKELKAGASEVLLEWIDLSVVRPRTWRSIVLAPDGPGQQPTTACAKWTLSELDA
jgi:hypothetical protein